MTTEATLSVEQEALLEGASALRYKAERLAALNGNHDPACGEQILIWREQATLLDGLAQSAVAA